MKLGVSSLRTVLILGAGATRGAIGDVLVKRKHVRAPLNADFFIVAEKLAEAEGENSYVAARLRRVKRALREDLLTPWPPPMETAFSLLYTMKDFPEIYANRRGKKPAPGERHELEDFLVLLTRILAAVDRTVPEGNGYDRLASVLNESDTVITLNYDTALDSALVRRGWDPRTGYAIGGGSQKVKWYPPKGGSSLTLANVTLLKLHGSLNWWVRGSSRSVSNVFDSKPVLVTAPRRNEQAGKIRQIIPPIYGKVFAHEHWRRVWTKAFKALCEAERLVVVGCSIVETDYHLQALLRRVVKLRKTRGNVLKEVVLVDRAKIRRRWKKALRGLSMTHEIDFPRLESFLTKGLDV